MQISFCNFLILVFIVGFCNNESFAKEYNQEIETSYNKENFVQKETKSTEELIYYPVYSKIHDEYIPESKSISEFGVTGIGIRFSKEIQGDIFNKKFEYQNIKILNDPMLFLNARFSNNPNNLHLTLNLGAGIVKFLDFSDYNTTNLAKYSNHKSFSFKLGLDFNNFNNKIEFSHIGKKVKTEDIITWFNFFSSSTSTTFGNFWINFLSSAFSKIPNSEKQIDNKYSENIIKTNLSSSYNIHLFTSNIGSLHFYLGGMFGLISSPFSENVNSIYNTFMPIFGIKYQNNFSVLKIGNNLIEISLNLSI